jgi:hypothetical protein
VSVLGVAFKEWAVICEALASGPQAIILRKGGIAESGGVFRVEHERFWLYPTHAHQQQGGIVEEARPILDRVARPADGVVRLTHFAEVRAVRYVEELEAALALTPLHVWSRETVEARFKYRTPGLFVLAVRVFAAAASHEVIETPAYAGCKSWVQLECGLEATGDPVLGDGTFTAVVEEMERLLKG